MRVALLGFGLIGGSIAAAIRGARADWTIAAWSPSGAGPAEATTAGIVDEASRSAGEAVAGADLVVLAAPPLACLELLDELSLPGVLAPGAVVTDVASTKSRIGEAADSAGVRFVGGHPMAGRETSGFGAATADLFAGRPWVIVPGTHADDAAIALVESLVAACGARPIRMSAPEHDAATAAISHLPLILSAALVEAVAGNGDAGQAPGWAAAAALAAGGWESMTRLARGEARMGAEIAATNPGPIAARLRDVQQVLDNWLADLERDGGPDADAMATHLEAVRRRLEDQG
jgi:prephenate dehydrogenase